MFGSQEGAFDVAIVGGAGHVGLPLALVMCSRGMRVLLIDEAEAALRTIASGLMPFVDIGSQEMLESALDNGLIAGTGEPLALELADSVVLTIGTPVDRHMNPQREVFSAWIEKAGGGLRERHLLVLRSTVSPGTTKWLRGQIFNRFGFNPWIANCPERAIQGHGFQEIATMPQIVGADDDETLLRATQLFSKVTTGGCVGLTTLEAEFAKLFTNAFRYINFATANEFMMIASDAGVDYSVILDAMKFKYPRANAIPNAGFAAGPCLFKDTAQLEAHALNRFSLGRAATQVNEGLPLYVVDRLYRSFPLATSTVALLGVAFKKDSDDTRESLAFKLKRRLEDTGATVMLHDPLVTHADVSADLSKVIGSSDLVVIGAPHSIYAELQTDRPVLDIWNVTSRQKCPNLVSLSGLS